MRILHGKGFSQDEREKTVETIQHSILQQMQVLVDTADELEIVAADPGLVHAFQELDPTSYSADTADIVGKLWEDAGIQETYSKRSKFQLNDSAA
jgi:guanine nucleotide-binding protein G(q) subunit alpha